jgi:hypothetical protein
MLRLPSDIYRADRYYRDTAWYGSYGHAKPPILVVNAEQAVLLSYSNTACCRCTWLSKDSQPTRPALHASLHTCTHFRHLLQQKPPANEPRAGVCQGWVIQCPIRRKTECCTSQRLSLQHDQRELQNYCKADVLRYFHHDADNTAFKLHSRRAVQCHPAACCPSQSKNKLFLTLFTAGTVMLRILVGWSHSKHSIVCC